MPIPLIVWLGVALGAGITAAIAVQQSEGVTGEEVAEYWYPDDVTTDDPYDSRPITIPEVIDDTLGITHEDGWSGFSGIFEWRVNPHAIPWKPSELLRAIMSIGNIASLTDIDEEKVIEDGEIYFIPFPEFKIGGNFAYFPIKGSEEWTLSGEQTTYPRVILNLIIVVVLAIATYYLGPRVLGYVKTAFPQLASLSLNTYSAIKDAMWKKEVITRFDLQDTTLPISLDTEHSQTEDAVILNAVGNVATIVTKVESTETDLKDYIDTKVYRPWY